MHKRPRGQIGEICKNSHLEDRLVGIGDHRDRVGPHRIACGGQGGSQITTRQIEARDKAYKRHGASLRRNGNGG